VIKGFFLFLLLPSTAFTQTIGSGVTVGAGVSIGAPFISAPVAPGIVFSPRSQHFSGTINSAISYPANTAATLFYDTSGYPVSPADTLYSSALSLASTTTVNALAYISGTVRQQADRSSSGWKTVFDTSNTTLPAGCPNSTTGGGVAGVITACTFDTTALSNTALHLAFASTAGGTSQRQVLWTMGGGKCNDCTEWTQSFDIQPAEDNGHVWAYENDMQLWDDSRGLELTAGLQCLKGNGSNIWEVSGQSGWTSTGVACSLPSGQWTHVEAHAHRIIGNKACTFNGSPTECIYYDWISINGVITTLNKTFPAHPLPAGWSGGCYNQQQLDTNASGTVGEYIKNKNMTCGYGTQATGSATYTNP
jgi:hypothetical protein